MQLCKAYWEVVVTQLTERLLPIPDESGSNSVMDSFFNRSATQLVILPSHIPLIGQGGGILLFCYSMICVSGIAIFDLSHGQV